MIYCVEDDLNIRDLMMYALKSVDMASKGFECGREMFIALEEEIPDLIILDIMLPGEDGVSILNRLKNNDKYKNIPIIMATAKGTEYDKVSCLDAGADDYLVKPFGMMEMISRIKAVLRRYQKNNGEIIKIQGIEINTKLRRVKVDDEVVQLTLKEYDLLLTLAQNVNMVFSREQLLSMVWNSDYVGESRTIDVHIKTLRNKLGNYKENIKTVHGIGYLMEK